MSCHKSMLSLMVFTISEKSFSKLYYDSIESVENDNEEFSPASFLLNNEGKTISLDVGNDYINNIIENPGEGFLYLFDISNSESAIEYEIEACNLDEVLIDIDLREIFKYFKFIYFDDLHFNLNRNSLKQIHLIFNCCYWRSYEGDYDGSCDLVGYLNDDKIYIEI